MDERTGGQMELQVVARIHSEFPEKFGIPRQGQMVASTRGVIRFEPLFRTPDIVRGIEGFTHLWLIWGFHANRGRRGAATVRPPRLGGNERLGVFATRSPNRPNPLGLTCVRLERVELEGPQGPELHVSGVDLMDGTPIYDIKPYVPYADAHPEAGEGFATEPVERLEVVCPPALLEQLPPEERETLLEVLACDPRPRYQKDPERVYGMAFSRWEVRFTVAGQTLTVRDLTGRTE